jgi:hypothetical protein
MACIRQINLYAFWSRSKSIVSGNQENIGTSLMLSKALRLEGLYDVDDPSLILITAHTKLQLITCCIPGVQDATPRNTLSLMPFGSFKPHIPITLGPQPKPIALLWPLVTPRANTSISGRIRVACSASLESWKV